MHTGDVGGQGTDYRTYSGVYGDRALQIVIGPAQADPATGAITHTVYADTDTFNPHEDLVGLFGHTFTEVFPGVMGFNVGCGL